VQVKEPEATVLQTAPASRFDLVLFPAGWRFRDVFGRTGQTLLLDGAVRAGHQRYREDWRKWNVRDHL
jgi:hypothetical protein